VRAREEGEERSSHHQFLRSERIACVLLIMSARRYLFSSPHTHLHCEKEGKEESGKEKVKVYLLLPLVLFSFSSFMLTSFFPICTLYLYSFKNVHLPGTFDILLCGALCVSPARLCGFCVRNTSHPPSHTPTKPIRTHESVRRYVCLELGQ
jgi:hypothetical protein